jgi:hypothetical protein
MDFREAHLNEIDILNTLWWMWCNSQITLSDIKLHVGCLDLEIEFITFNGYKFTNKDKTITYSYGKQTTKESH